MSLGLLAAAIGGVLDASMASVFLLRDGNFSKCCTLVGKF